MKILNALVIAGLVTSGSLCAQQTFDITGTAIPAQLLKINYGTLPKGIQAYDLNICNLAEARHPITSSEIFQALSQSQSNLHPIGRQIMLEVILRNQNHSAKTWLNLVFASTTSILSILGTSRHAMPSAGMSAAALGSLIGQQLLATWNPVLTADQVEKFESQVLEPALVMDGGSCVERTVFTTVPIATDAAPRNLSNIEFHVR